MGKVIQFFCAANSHILERTYVMIFRERFKVNIGFDTNILFSEAQHDFVAACNIYMLHVSEAIDFLKAQRIFTVEDMKAKLDELEIKGDINNIFEDTKIEIS